jgi:DNA-binding NarL/FixJ family response regulator
LSASGARTRAGALVEPLSERETEILRLLAQGASNREIAEALVIAEGTTKNHITSILGKLGVRDRTQAALKARELGLV